MRILAALLICPCTVGCVGIAYPSISHTPTIQIEDPATLAFRVESECVQTGGLVAGAMSFTKTIECLPAEKGLIQRQPNYYWEYSYVVLPSRGESRTRDLQVRLYRRGYHTVIIPAEQWWASSTIKPAWTRAKTLKDMEEAIDVIAGASYARLSATVRKLAAEEYAWLAGSEWSAGPGKEKERARLLEKARKLEQTAPPTV